ncbi:hypothetical protein TVAG_161590 [Trichomonas vaginalis G3]|uniref:Uncharacterized protein n=1 Tax=Trichomonas vaginalis (strain ATCC PRA-98 / G3) TaxID=412133 RepID=A2EUN2_TRIV3|nr:cilia- and flagella-associated protein 58-related family [Trichomonas vaginalis G3]EAY03620.1 hypothetical protein TVAG_161590 [Trichomonas vaginalis G3]KAI5524714.1 cilia- and flagella-associated protein 58-related family [Trichomonas vaginalis G3]|eukprot:XP_001315843.1 hypothetical protein [Trichomonas vaginalis G3]
MRGNNPKDEASQLFEIISQRFLQPVQSVQQADQVFELFINEYNSTKQELQTLTERISRKYESNIKLLTQKLKRSKSNIEDLEIQLSTAQRDAENAKKQANEQSKITEEATYKINRLESTIEHLKLQINLITTPVVPQNQETSAPEMLEDMIEEQNKEITALSKQRESILKLFHRYDQIISESEQRSQELISTNNTLKEKLTDLEVKLSNSNNELNNLAKDLDGKICEDVRSMLNHEKLKGPSDFIEEIVRVANELSKSKKTASPSSNKSQKSDTEVYAQILGRLEDTMRWILYGEKFSDEILVRDEKVRSRLLCECTRIEKFIDEKMYGLDIKELPQQLTMFSPDAFSSVKLQLNELFKYGDKSIMNNGQVRTLFVLFAVVCLVNKQICEKISDMSEIVKCAENLQNQSSTIRKLNEENRQLKNKLNEEKEVKPVEVKQNTQNEKDYHDEYEQEKEKNEELQKKNNELNNKIRNLEIELNNIQEKSQEHITNHKIDNEAANDQISELSKKNEELTETIKEMKSNMNKIMRKTSKNLTSLESELQTEKEKNKTVESQVELLAEENKYLNNELEEMKSQNKLLNNDIENYSNQVISLKVSKENLHDKLQRIQAKLYKRIKDLESEIETSKSDYLLQIGKLQNDIVIEKNVQKSLQETIDKLIEQKKCLVEANTKITLSEKSLRLKLQQQEETHKVDLNNRETKTNIVIQSIKSQLSSEINNLTEKQNQIKKELMSILNSTENPAKVDVFDLIEQINRKISTTDSDLSISNDAKQVKIHCKILPQDSILSHVFKFEKKIEQCERDIQDRIKEIEMYKTKLSKLNETEKNIVLLREDLKSWEGWARSLFMQISDRGIPKNTDIMKRTLEDAILNDTNGTKCLRKIHQLRTEKKILSSKSISPYIENKSDKEPSMTTLIVVFASLTRFRMQSISH